MRKTISGMLTVALCAFAFDAAAHFVSTDPVKADPNTGGNFNRYSYANNNPYKFTDPDGRIAYLVNKTVYIPIYFTGSGATQKTIDGVQIIAVARLHEALTEAMQLSDELT